MHTSGASGSEASVREPTRFGKYHLIASLGQGGMAKVYLALLAGPSDFKKLLVIKILRQDALASSEDGLKMFWAEARLAARLVHPNIVHTHEVGEHEGRVFLAMEHLDGQPLSAVLNRARVDQDIPLDELVRVLSEIARGLHYAHQLKGFAGEPLHVVHRDISPQNVIVTYEGHGKLVDFGIAKSEDGEQTQLGLVKGKLDYIAPEQLRGERVDARADVFALGAMLWEVVTGQRFAGGRKVSDVNKVQARLVGGERKLRAVKPDAPLALERIVERAIAVDPSQRFPDAASFADALDTALARNNLRPNARVLATCMATLFDDERAAMHKLIDTQVQLVESNAAAPSLLSSTPPDGESTSTDARKRRAGFGLYVADTHTDEGSAVHAAATAARSSTFRPESKQLALGLTLTGLVAVTLLGVSWFRGDQAPRSEPVAAGSSRPAPPPAAVSTRAPAPSAQESADTQGPQAERPTARSLAAPPEVDSIRFRLSVTPAWAVARVDGVPVAPPFLGSFRKDNTLHHVEVSAPGYRPTKQFVTFDNDKTLEIKLERAHGLPRGALPEPSREQTAQAAAPEPRPTEPEAVVPTPPSEETKPASGEPVIERPNPYTSE